MSSASFRDRLAAIQAKKSLDVHASSHGPSSWEREIARGASVGTGCGDDVFRVWDGGVFLARQLMWLVNAGLLNFTGKTVLELGSGTGIVGLTCAYLNANHVILTDLPRVTPNLANIVETNAHIQIPGSTDAIGDRCRVAVLAWGTTPLETVLSRVSPTETPTVDVVIASDLAAPVKFVAPLLDTLSQLFAENPALQFVLATQTHREFTGPLIAACMELYFVRKYEDRELDGRFISPDGRQAMYLITRK